MEGGIDKVNFAKYNPNRSRIVSKLMKNNTVLGIRILLKRIIFCTLTYCLKEEFEIGTIFNTIELVSKGKRLQISNNDILFKFVDVNEFRENFYKKQRCIGITFHEELRSPLNLDQERLKMIQSHHEQGQDHLGFRATILSIYGEYYWKGMRQEIKNFVFNCNKCRSRFLTQKWLGSRNYQ